MIGWLLVNLFVVLYVGVTAGYLWLLGSLVMWSDVPQPFYGILFTIAAVTALLAGFFTMRYVHQWIERSVNR